MVLPRGGAGGDRGQGGSLLFSRRALQVYAFLFVNTLIFVMRSQWIVSGPSNLDTNVLSRHDADLNEELGALQGPFDHSQSNHIHDSLRKETRRNLDREHPPAKQGSHSGGAVSSIEIGHQGHVSTEHTHTHTTTDASGNDKFFLPTNQDILDSIYARGKSRIKAELDRRHNNISALEPFNPWGPVYIWDWFSPDYNCPTMERIGRVGDGGKWICGVDVLRERKCVAYSYGVNKDLSFELEMIGRTGCEVHAFDPTVGGVPPDCKDNPHITFHKQALGPVSKPSEVFMLVETLLDTMKRQGHTFIDVLKVDIEGSEWDTFRAMLPEKALPFGQLLIELHFRNVAEVFEFFENMDTHGFRIFMRETNHNPCAAGKLPIAVEFSLINPHAYFKGAPEASAVKAITSRPEPKQYSGVVYVLSHKGNLERLSKMLVNFEKNYNRFYHYPVVIFHEDFGEVEKKMLREVTRMRLQFREIAFSIPAWLDKDKIPERTPCSYHSSTVGYRHMNRFLAYFAAEELSKEYEWQWRLDDDSLITEEVGYDVFRLMAENNKKYGYTNIVQDDAKCVLGLWNATREYIDKEKIEPTFFTRWTEGAVFYNNFEVSHRSIWTSPQYKAFFDHIDKLGGIYYHRWGDAPIRSIGVSLFVNESQVHQFTDVAYTHLPFIARNASGLPPPQHTLFSRAGGSFHPGNCSAGGHNVTASGHGGHGHDHIYAGNGTCFSGRPSGILYLVLNDEPGQVQKLVETLKSVDVFYNDQFKYPVAVFGTDLTYEKRQLVRKATRSVVEFHDLSFLEKEALPAWVDESRVPALVDCAFADDSVLDRKRNRYMASRGVGKLASEYDWMWRLVPGAVLTENVTSDPFATLAAGGKSFGYLMTVSDDKRCVKGLQEATRSFVKRKMESGFVPAFLEVLPEDAVFYDGFAISHSSLWQSPEYQSFFDFIDREGGMLYHRWTEMNVLTQALALFVPTTELQRFSDVGFEHAPFVKQTSNRGILKKPLEKEWKDRSIAARPAPELSALMAPRRFGFLGADVATSLRLPSVAGYGAYMWLLGDTYIGTSDGNKRQEVFTTINNALAFLPAGAGAGAGAGVAEEVELEPSDVSFFWRQGEDGLPTAPFVAENGKSVLWPVSGVSIDYHNTAKIVLFAQRVQKTHDLTEFLVADGMNFEVEGTSLIFIDNPAAAPSRWRYRVVDMPGTDATHNWFAGVALAGGKEVADSPEDMLYLVGNVGTRGLGVYDEASKNVLGRIKVKDLLLEQFGRLEVLVGEEKGDEGEERWVREAAPERRRAIFSPANAETTLQYNSELGAWVALAVDSVTAQLVLWTSPHLAGPWTSTVIHSIPAPYDDLSHYRCYAGKGHPELSDTLPGQDVELVFSYVCNSPADSSYLFEEGQLGLYAPQFVRVHLGAPVDGRPSRI